MTKEGRPFSKCYLITKFAIKYISKILSYKKYIFLFNILKLNIYFIIFLIAIYLFKPLGPITLWSTNEATIFCSLTSILGLNIINYSFLLYYLDQENLQI